ncbi:MULTISPECIES: hypothetical protein [unclassified Pseudomonas]|uniref:DUF6933 domain-containing protein n=1 Tax=unclassified Pseudomonas TaxID=196821 RepID=UPI0008919925|nr:MULTISPECIES: hypothetical protein [unclassified Pseudomonas]SCZ09774.1 hypothetical protein SAMN03159391_05371 [Pseudomonas sp. NFACC37-1]SFN62080.1 hypothetical protein SAMN03159304_00506 [Pseudomonas sp. NFACC24-1]
MLIFNCTEAACAFFSRVNKGKKITPVGKPPSSVIEDDEVGELAEQWLVHAITVQRKHVLFVIHVQTRYCMIFADAKKADVEGFIQRFSERWINGLMRHAGQHDLLRWVDDEPMMERFQKSCREYVFYKRGHRGAQKHINEISWIFEDCAAEWGTLPADEYAAGRFDGDMNDTPRSSKGHKGYYFPDEEMIVHWLRRYGGLDESAAQAARERRMEVKREIWAFERQLAQGAQ